MASIKEIALNTNNKGRLKVYAAPKYSIGKNIEDDKANNK